LGYLLMWDLPGLLRSTSGRAIRSKWRSSALEYLVIRSAATEVLNNAEPHRTAGTQPPRVSEERCVSGRVSAGHRRGAAASASLVGGSERRSFRAGNDRNSAVHDIRRVARPKHHRHSWWTRPRKRCRALQL